jgi:hypothetical protein
MEVEVMEQLGLPMLTVYEGPRLVDAEVVAACKTYREAVRACWDMRTRRNLTKRKLAEDAGLYASHVTDYPSGTSRPTGSTTSSCNAATAW